MLFYCGGTLTTVLYFVGVHQVALLTHIDQICPETAKDVTKVYKSSIIRNMVGFIVI